MSRQKADRLGLPKLVRRLVLVLAALILGAILLLAAFGQWLTPMDPGRQDITARLLAPGASSPAGLHFFGTDSLGRDMLSLIIAGAAPAVGVSLAAVAGAIAAGVILGMVAASVGRPFTSALQFLTSVQLAFPFFLLAITIVAIFSPSMPLVILVISLGLWVQFARMTMAESERLQSLEFIEAIKAMRGGMFRILLRHILPNVIPHVIVLATFAFGAAIMTESGLSFIGLGVPTETPTWGRMIANGRDYIASAWWLTAGPGLAIFLLVLSVNLLGEELREAIDPRRSVGVASAKKSQPSTAAVVTQ